MQPALFFQVAAPLISARDVGDRPIGDRWSEGEYRIAMKLFGLVPIGWQAIIIEFPQSDDQELVLRDRGYGPMLRIWDHRISVSPAPDGGTRYTDSLRLDAGIMTPIAAMLVAQFFKHRQRRLRALDAADFRDLDG